ALRISRRWETFAAAKSAAPAHARASATTRLRLRRRRLPCESVQSQPESAAVARRLNRVIDREVDLHRLLRRRIEREHLLEFRRRRTELIDDVALRRDRDQRRRRGVERRVKSQPQLARFAERRQHHPRPLRHPSPRRLGRSLLVMPAYESSAAKHRAHRRVEVTLEKKTP